MAAQTGKTPGHYTTLVYNSNVIGGISSITGMGQNFPEVDLTDLAAAQKFVGAGIPECKIVVKGKADSTATTGEYANFATGAGNGSQTGLALLIKYGIRQAVQTGEPMLSNTLMWVSQYERSISDVNGALEFTATLSTALGSVFSWTTAP